MKEIEGSAIQPGLYGLINSNRNFANPYYWGKNQFNTSFPIALACYMRDRNLPFVYIRHTEGLTTEVSEITADELFNTEVGNEGLYFKFESRYVPHERFVYDELVTIDCLVMHGEKYLRPLEIKLTTLPDQTTHNKDESEYGCEIVVRSATMKYLALSMAESLSDEIEAIRALFTPVCSSIQDWNNRTEMSDRLPRILKCLNSFFATYYEYQKPLLVQPVWKTIGKSPVLAENCLDIFVWSDFALTKLFMDSAMSSTSPNISRHQRAALRLARFIYEFSTNPKVYQDPIYDGMPLGNQTDKEFSVSGAKTRKYMACDRLTKLKVRKSEIKNIVLGGGERYLSPERRFDAILYFSNDLFE